jgi:hypothetical protein
MFIEESTLKKKAPTAQSTKNEYKMTCIDALEIIRFVDFICIYNLQFLRKIKTASDHDEVPTMKQKSC